MEQIITQDINITSTIVEIINNILSTLLNSIDKNIFPVIDELVFLDRNVLSSGDKMNKLLSTSPTSGVLLLANCLFSAFVLYYAARLVISQLTGANIESPSKFFMRAFLSGIAMNYSLPICTFLINTASYISLFFCNLGESVFGKPISFTSLISLLNFSATDSQNLFSIDGILSGMLSISSFALMISFALRYILVKVLVIASPFAILCLSNSSTEGFFKSWFRCLLSLLILQVVISIILLIPYSLIRENTETIFNKILILGSIMALLKSNQFVKEFMGRYWNRYEFSEWD